MATYKGHIIGGIIAFALITPIIAYFSPNEHVNSLFYLFFLGITLTGALFPDIDTHSTIRKIGYYMTPLLVLFALINAYYHLLIPLFFLWFFIFLLRHRTITHRFWFLIVCTGLSYFFITEKYPDAYLLVLTSCAYFLSGAVSHLFLDNHLGRHNRSKRSKK